MKKRPCQGLLLNGRGDRIRTYDPLVPNQMRYQTALRPDMGILMPASVFHTCGRFFFRAFYAQNHEIIFWG